MRKLVTLQQRKTYNRFVFLILFVKSKIIKLLVVCIIINIFKIFGQEDDRRFLIPKDEPIPEHILGEIKRQVEHEILYYKMIVNPEIRSDSFITYIGGGRVIRSPYNVIFNPPFTNRNYRMIMDVERWGVVLDYAFKDFYLITKTGNRFTNNATNFFRTGSSMREWIPIPPPQFADTLQYDLWSNHFPHNSRFIVHFDSETPGLFPHQRLSPLGGDMRLRPVRWDLWLPDWNFGEIISLIVEMRLNKFGIRQDRNNRIRSLDSAIEFRNDRAALDSLNFTNEINRTRSTYDCYYYVPLGLDLSDGFPVLVRVPVINNFLSGEMEIIFYRPTLNPENCSVSWQEVRYFIYNNPSNYEAILPRIRDMTDEEVRSIRETPYRLFFENDSFYGRMFQCFIEFNTRHFGE